MSELTPNFGALGMDLEQSLKQLKKGKLTYALNGMIEGFDGQYVNYQNEEGNELCVTIPEGYRVIGVYTIYEQNRVIYFLCNPGNGLSEIGESGLEDCTYKTIINAKCLNFNVNYPILSAVHRIDNCSTQIFWVDGYNKDRFINLDELPYLEVPNPDGCENDIVKIVDCNKLSINPIFSIPQITVESVDGDGTLLSGAYQFAVQYANASGQGYTSFYSVTNPISIFNVNNITLDLNSPVNKSIKVIISELDNTGYYDYINIAVIKTIQGIATVDQIGSYKIVGSTQTVIYTGQKTIDLSIQDIFQKYPIYEKSNDITAINDILIRDQLVSAERLNYQEIANKITIQWQTWKMGKEYDYTNELVAAEYRGYMRDEVYAFEIVFLLRDGRQTDRFHIPGREALPEDLTPVLNYDTVDCTLNNCEEPQTLPRWRVYNTGTKICNKTEESQGSSLPPNITQEESTPTPTAESTGYTCEYWNIITGDYSPNEDPAYYTFSSYCCTTGEPFSAQAAPNSNFGVCMRSDKVEFGLGLMYQKIGSCTEDAVWCKTVTPPPPDVPEEEPTCVPNLPSAEDCYLGPWECGLMSYWESEELYPCREDIWGELAGKPIRHHKFPDSLITHTHDERGNIYPIGIRISLKQIQDLIENSSLTEDQKSEIIGFKVVRGNRANNKSVVAKGLINNVGKYKKNDVRYYFPNYPYNDVGDDPFLSKDITDPTTDTGSATGGIQSCSGWIIDNAKDSKIQYIDCVGNLVTLNPDDNKKRTYCAIQKPYLLDGEADIDPVAEADDNCKPIIDAPTGTGTDNFNGFLTCESHQRFTFHSPDTHFYQPFLGTILKLETIEQGTSTGHFVQVKNHARYKLYNSALYLSALGGALLVAAASGMYGTSTRPFDGVAFFTCYAVLKDIFEKATPRINYAYQYNSISNYNAYVNVPNMGNKQRQLDIALYMNPGMASVGDIHTVNNFQRESSIYLKARVGLPYTHEVGGVVDNSRWLFADDAECNILNNTRTTNVSSYYASIKKCSPTQYGQIYSYDSVDTGFQVKFRPRDERDELDIFGGDIFINKFGLKIKLPYFFDNRVNAPDESDVFYNEIGNIGVPKYWFSMDTTKEGGGFNLYGLPNVHLHCQTNAWGYRKGRMYLYSYGIPYFYCESEVNVDYRQAFNTREGDFYPRVATYIPDEWLQEAFVSINYDNTYYYNKMYSKQNTENEFTFLPPDFDTAVCTVIYPYRAVFSEASSSDPLSNFSNNWLIYKPSSFFDFPQSFGKLTALDGMEYRQVLARFENRTQIYNALLTAPTSTNDVYLGQPIFSDQTPPIDLAVTDMGYLGSRHKFLLKTEFGTVTTDDKRGHVFLLNGKNAKNLTEAASGVEQFFNKNLEVQLPKYIPNVPLDNHFNGVGITGVYDAKYNRLILTKLDYVPLVDGITYDNGNFYYEQQEVLLTNPEYFCNKSFTISYDFDYQSWISFHSYTPSYYIGSSNFFLSGLGNTTWRHLTANNYCSFYGEKAPYIIEYPYAFEYLDEILQAVTDYSKTLQYTEDGDQIEVNDVYFNKVILYNNQQCSGILKLHPKPKNNLNEYMKYPIYSADSKTILYTKSDNLYKINQFWSLVKDHKQPIFKKTCKSLSFDKEINQDNMNYSKMSFKKAPLRAKDLKCRFILDDRTDTRIVSQLVAIETQKSYK